MQAVSNLPIKCHERPVHGRSPGGSDVVQLSKPRDRDDDRRPSLTECSNRLVAAVPTLFPHRFRIQRPSHPRDAPHGNPPPNRQSHEKLLAAPASVGIELFVLAGVAVFSRVDPHRRARSRPDERSAFRDQPCRCGNCRSTPRSRCCADCAAYLLSLAFTLVYGIIAAHNRRAEKVMLPALDVLQSLPVLTFLPGLVLLFVHLFPTRQLGLELACVVTIFTAQAWNMCVQLFRQSVRGIPPPLREVTDPESQRLAGVPPARSAGQHDRAGLELDDVDGRGVGSSSPPSESFDVQAARAGFVHEPPHRMPATCGPRSAR